MANSLFAGVMPPLYRPGLYSLQFGIVLTGHPDIPDATATGAGAVVPGNAGSGTPARTSVIGEAGCLYVPLLPKVNTPGYVPGPPKSPKSAPSPSQLPGVAKGPA